MIGANNEFDAHIRILEKSARVRADAVRTRITALIGFCTVAESNVGLGLLIEARDDLERIKRAQEEIDRHLNDPRHVAPAIASELRVIFDKTEPRIRKLETSIKALSLKKKNPQRGRVGDEC